MDLDELAELDVVVSDIDEAENKRFEFLAEVLMGRKLTAG